LLRPADPPPDRDRPAGIRSRSRRLPVCVAPGLPRLSPRERRAVAPRRGPLSRGRARDAHPVLARGTQHRRERCPLRTTRAGTSATVALTGALSENQEPDPMTETTSIEPAAVESEQKSKHVYFIGEG